MHAPHYPPQPAQPSSQHGTPPMTETVTIGEREFRIGAWYAPRKPGAMVKLRQIVRRHPIAIEYRVNLVNARIRSCEPYVFLRWAGEEVPAP